MNNGVGVVHLMKTGGTSLNRSLRSNYDVAHCYPAPDELAKMNAQKVAPQLLLGLPAEERAALQFVSVHMPAWVLRAAVPHLATVTMLRHPVERTVSHLRQLARTAYRDWTVEELWHHDPVRRRLQNYQTQVFALTEEMYTSRPQLEGDLDTLDDETKRAFAIEVRAGTTTGIDQAIEVDDDVFTAAKAMLEGIDLVGTTDDLDEFGGRIGDRIGVELTPIGTMNRAGTSEPLSSSLLAEIEAASRFDLELYEHARSMR